MRRLIMLILMVSTTLIVAQPDAGIDDRTLLAFPHSVTFQAGIPGNINDLESLTLEVAPGTEFATVVEFPDQGQIEQFSRSLFATYEWAIPFQSSPMLFSEIPYTWRGVIEGNGFRWEGVLLYADQLRQWSIAEASSVPLALAADASLGNIAVLIPQYVPVYELLQRETGLQPNVRLIFVPQTNPFGCDINAQGEPVTPGRLEYTIVEVPCDPERVHRLLREDGYEEILLDTRLVAHRDLLPPLVDAFYEPLWQSGTVPNWFKRGLISFYDPFSGDSLFLAQQSTRTGQVVPLSQMSAIPEETETRLRWQAQAHGMVLYIASSFGVDTVFELARLAGSGEFAAIYEAVTGQPLDSLLPAYEDWLFSPIGEQAFGYVPYLPDTPVPSLTPTYTSTSPPQSPTLTFTPTPDYTETPRPSRTPIPPTATVTPLPAQSFVVRSTPLPTPVPDTSFFSVAVDSELIVTILIAVIVVAAAVVLAFWLRGRR